MEYKNPIGWNPVIVRAFEEIDYHRDEFTKFNISQIYDFINSEIDRDNSQQSLTEILNNTDFRLPAPFRKFNLVGYNPPNSPGLTGNVEIVCSDLESENTLVVAVLFSEPCLCGFCMAIEYDSDRKSRKICFSDIGTMHGEKVTVNEGVDVMARYVRVVISLFSYFLSWKRVVHIDESKPTRQQRRAAQRSDRPVEIDRKIIIDGWIKKYNSVRGSVGGGIGKRFHAVMAHSRLHGLSNPLFGCRECLGNGHSDGTKPHVGRFWIPSHFAGDKLIGVVNKSYEVNTPESLEKGYGHEEQRSAS